MPTNSYNSPSSPTSFDLSEHQTSFLPTSNTRVSPFPLKRKRAAASLQRATSAPLSHPTAQTGPHGQMTTATVFTARKGVYIIEGKEVLSMEAHIVQETIHFINAHLCLPPNAAPMVVALAAMAVFSKPTQAAHWYFWNLANRDATYSCVKKEQAKPNKLGWVAEPRVLDTYQADAWVSLVAGEPWAARLCTNRKPKPEEGPTTRKRKAAALETSSSGELASSTPAKRTRNQTKRKAPSATSTPRAVTQRLPTPSKVTRSTAKAAQVESTPVLPSTIEASTSTSSTTSHETAAVSSVSTPSSPPSRLRSNSQTSGTVVGDRSPSVSTAVGSPQSDKEAIAEVAPKARRSARNTIASAKQRTTPAKELSAPPPPPAARVVVPSTNKKRKAESEDVATKTSAASPAADSVAPRPKRARTTRRT
ncbi:hypothetical protein CYLTODRAFT_490869 [Cylindrobasidium torrendii FP15055 ss-10]|uniref:Uncharacterized protein n=1 Tax=Cylindrobasidium torrendii FP15055 ss-10 TaxID=1314674 RepID=A0A0D7B988_9AGAR|nr:hypothetical protein CYLTODRAFT_490869 [Cylindrobasidium torrendii FP15055 ss-10]